MASKRSLVCCWTAVTETPAITAPEVSDTAPVITAVDWAWATEAETKRRTAHRKMLMASLSLLATELAGSVAFLPAFGDTIDTCPGARDRIRKVLEAVGANPDRRSRRGSERRASGRLYRAIEA